VKLMSGGDARTAGSTVRDPMRLHVLTGDAALDASFNPDGPRHGLVVASGPSGRKSLIGGSAAQTTTSQPQDERPRHATHI